MDLALAGIRLLLPALYAVALGLYGWVFFADTALRRRWANGLLAGVVAFHGLYLVLLNVAFGPHPISSRAEAFSTAAFAIALVFLVVERWQGSPGTGMFVLVPVFVFQLVSSGLPGEIVPQDVGESSPLFALHTGAAVVGYSAFALSAAHGLLYLLLYRELKRRRFGLIYERLPSLDVLANMTVRAALVGFLFLTAAIGLGMVWSILRADSGYWSDPMVVSTLVIWALYALYVASYFVLGWRGSRTVYLSLAGFVVLLGSMIVVSALYSSFHVFS